MKTKHILTAIALPALLAACSQDEDLSGALSQKDFSNIPTVDVNFTASIDGNSPTTRMATKFDWEEGDKVGLAWLGEGDKITPNGDAYQNHPLFCTDAAAKSFKTETMLYVGSYYAYMPYNAEITSVVPMEFDASNQELAATSASYAKKAIYISPKLTVLDKGAAGIGKNTKLNLSRLSNAVTVNLTFGNAAKFEGLKVMGISVDAKETGSASVLPASFEYKPTKDAGVKDWSEMESSAIVSTASSNFYGSAGPADATVGAIKATSKEGLAVTNDKLTTYILTLAATKAAEDLDVVVSTNYGDVTVNLTSSENADGEAGKAIVIKDKGTIEAKTIADAKIFNNFGASGSLDVYVDMSKLTTPSEVATQAELNEALKTLAITETTTPTTITVNPETQNSTSTVDLTDFTFPEGLKCAVTLKAGGNASSGFAFKGNTVINSQLVLASAATVDGTMTINNLVDEKKAQQTALTMNGKVLTVNAGAKLINEGKIDISVPSSGITTNNKTTKAAAAEFVSNANTATVNVGSGTFANNGKVQWIAGTLPTSLTGTVYANALTLNQLAGASKAFTNVNATNEVTIDGALSIGNEFQTLDFANIKKLTIKGKVTLSMKAKYDVTNLAEINIEAGSLNFTDGDDSSAKDFAPKAGCKLTLSKDTELNVAAGIELNLGADSSIDYEDATVNNQGKIIVASTSGAGYWIGNSASAVDPD